MQIKKRLKEIIPVNVQVFMKSVQHRRRDWYNYAVGGRWNEIGELQFDFLKNNGLKPDSYLLDVGCGSLRGGVHFINYLNQGRYYGIDIDKKLLHVAKNHIVKQYKLRPKNPNLVHMENFEFDQLNQKFDFAIAQSVFTHLPLNSIIRCIMNMEKVLVKGGLFFATFFENPDGKFNLSPVVQPHGAATYFDKNNYHYDFNTFVWIAEGTQMVTDYIGDWNHPVSQKMLMFTRK